MTSLLVIELTAAIGGSRPDGKQWYCYPSLDFNPTLACQLMLLDVRLRPAYSLARESIELWLQMGNWLCGAVSYTY